MRRISKRSYRYSKEIVRDFHGWVYSVANANVPGYRKYALGSMSRAPQCAQQNALYQRNHQFIVRHTNFHPGATRPRLLRQLLPLCGRRSERRNAPPLLPQLCGSPSTSSEPAGASVADNVVTDIAACIGKRLLQSCLHRTVEHNFADTSASAGTTFLSTTVVEFSPKSLESNVLAVSSAQGPSSSQPSKSSLQMVE